MASIMQIDRFLAGGTPGTPIPPLTLWGPPGTIWPSGGPLRLTVVSRGTPGARLRARHTTTYVTFEAQRVVGGTPTGGYKDISTTDDFAITEAAGLVVTFDLKATLLTRPAGLFLRAYASLEVVATAGSGF
ncbi:MAG: hypothetical protein IT336_15060 [Thermomicrobiales bacterium]|nr:hypothetical protein [Thermomicrobiales bacterium]